MATPFGQMMTVNTRVIPISEPNKVREITKLADGGMKIVFGDGRERTISKDDPEIQTFVVWTMVHDNDL